MEKAKCAGELFSGSQEPKVWQKFFSGGQGYVRQ